MQRKDLKMKKALLWLVTLMLIATFTLVGCKAAEVVVEEEAVAPAEGEEAVVVEEAPALIELSYWTLFSGGEGDYMTTMVNQFNDEHPNIKVVETRCKWEEYYPKLTTALVAKSGPDIGIMHTATLPDFASKNVLNPVDVEKLADIDDFVPSILAGGKYNGVQYAIPIDTHPLVLYYNKSVLREAGLVDDQGNPLVPENGDELLEYARQVKVETGKWGLSIEVIGYMVFRWWYGMLNQQGGSLLDNDGKAAAFADEKGLKALEYINQFITEGLAATSVSYPDSEAIFTVNESAFNINGVWAMGSYVLIDDPNFDFGVTLLPQVYGKPAVWGDSHNLVFPIQKTPDEKKLEAGLIFADWLSAHATEWTKAGHLPIRKSVQEDPEFLSMEGRKDYVETANFVVYPPSVVGWTEIQEVLKEMTELVLVAGEDPEVALKDSAEKVDDILASR